MEYARQFEDSSEEETIVKLKLDALYYSTESYSILDQTHGFNLFKGYAFKSIVEEMLGMTDGTFTFIVNRNDLSDLRHDVEILIKAGYVVREIEAL